MSDWTDDYVAIPEGVTKFKYYVEGYKPKVSTGSPFLYEPVFIGALLAASRDGLASFIGHHRIVFACKLPDKVAGAYARAKIIPFLQMNILGEFTVRVVLLFTDWGGSSFPHMEQGDVCDRFIECDKEAMIKNAHLSPFREGTGYGAHIGNLSLAIKRSGGLAFVKEIFGNMVAYSKGILEKKVKTYDDLYQEYQSVNNNNNSVGGDNKKLAHSGHGCNAGDAKRSPFLGSDALPITSKQEKKKDEPPFKVLEPKVLDAMELYLKDTQAWAKKYAPETCQASPGGIYWYLVVSPGFFGK